MNFDVWCETDVGLKRTSNQDSFLINRDLGLFVLADGMGGHSGGEVASTMAVQTVEDVVKTADKNLAPKQIIVNAYHEASKRIFARSEKENAHLKGMGTTLIVALWRDHTLYLGNVGDSRAYLFSSPFLWQITEDHSLLNEQIRAGILREDTAHRFVGRNVITRSVGFEKDVECDLLERKMVAEEMVLICSDGLSGLVPDKQLAEICETVPPSGIVARCIKDAKKNGGDDNVTVMLIRVKS